MGKTYIDTVKYIIKAEVEVNGLVDKPDVVGAIFGQTEGLMGDELDLRELQKNGRIGRIDVNLTSKSGKTYGVILVPSSLDMVETSIIASALETVDRIGPCEGRISVKKIEDTRNEKRKRLVERAKNLLKDMLNEEIPESREISQMVREQVKAAGIIEYGPEKLIAGPGILTMDDIILVEGRADVINLLKNSINNAVAIGGARVPRSIVELSKGKEVTVFLDGDRGGDIILQELIQAGVDIDFVARAPRGKEVEELTRKEVIKALRSKVPFEQEVHHKKFRYQKYERKKNNRYNNAQSPVKKSAAVSVSPSVSAGGTKSQSAEEKKEQAAEEPAYPKEKREEESTEKTVKKVEKEEKKEKTQAKKKRDMTKEVLFEELNSLEDTLKARLFDENGNQIEEVPVRDVIKTLKQHKNVAYLVFDGIITQRIVDLAKDLGIKAIVGLKIGNVSKKPANVELLVKG